jgi:hypothetical protein
MLERLSYELMTTETAADTQATKEGFKYVVSSSPPQRRSMDDMPTLYTSRIIINTAGASAYHSAEASGSARSAGGNLVCFS